MEIKNQNDALNALVSGIKLAVKRGAFELEEVGILLEAVKMFSQSTVAKVEDTVKQVVEKVEEAV